VTPTSYRSFAAQTQHYFSRPHEEVPGSPLTGASIWRGADLRRSPELWQVTLSPESAVEILSTARRVVGGGRQLGDIDASSFPLPRVQNEIAKWRRIITDGPGFVVVRGLPVGEMSTAEAEMAFWGIGHHLGIPGAQNPDQELLGHVRDYQEADPHVRLYRTAANINFHCDAADVVGLLCLAKARAGGQSRIVSTGWLFNEAFAEDPSLIKTLFEPFKLDGRGERRPDQLPWSEIAPCAYADGQLKTFYHSEYMRSVARHPGGGPTKAQLRLLDLYDSRGADPDVALEMWLEPGDMQFLSNHSIAHARTAYEDDPEQPRHLLRLWLSLSPQTRLA
jgi:hypothetical protein